MLTAALVSNRPQARDTASTRVANAYVPSDDFFTLRSGTQAVLMKISSFLAGQVRTQAEVSNHIRFSFRCDIRYPILSLG